ncbi:MAG TPA: hypothetical protein VFS59_03295 [Gemmatimonadaceae bacterium]|nr:hypothetical protein [Gemmatimonadaceae bacterium]
MMQSTSPTERAARRPLPSVLAVGVLFVGLGVVDIYQGVAPYLGSARRPPVAGDDMLVLAIGVAALVGGVFLLLGRNWARWLLAAWMALHVAISAGRPAQLAAHVVIFGVITFLLFRSRASAHFGPRVNRRPGVGRSS